MNPENDSMSASSAENATEIGSPASKTDVSSERTIESLEAENKRKGEKIIKLESKFSELEQKVADLQQKRNDPDTSSAERDSIDEKLKDLKDGKDWLKTIEQATATAVAQAEIIRANDYLEEKALELGMDAKDFAKLLQPYVKNSSNYYRRNVEAVSLWQKDQARIKSIEERERKLKERESEQQMFRETGGRMPRGGDSQFMDRFSKSKDHVERGNMAVDIIAQYSKTLVKPK